jgi:exonuclease SbcC
MQDIWITEVEIINFQSHKDTIIKLVRGSNAFIGTSNSGKTAAIRAIKWCLLNSPTGNAFIKMGEDETTVVVSLSNGKKVERKRNRKGTVNDYYLHENGHLTQEYTGFGSSVPPEILEAHGIVPIANDVYFQFADQLEAPFMLSLKPKKRAEVLGNLEELTRIDKALTDINDDIRTDGKRKKDLEKEGKLLHLEFERMRMEEERLSGKVDSLIMLKLNIESKSALKIYLERQLKRLSEITEITITIQTELSKATRITSIWQENLEERITWFNNLQGKVNRLKVVKEEIESISYMEEDKLKELSERQVSIEAKIGQFQNLEKSTQSLKLNRDAIHSVDGSWSEKAAGMNYDELDAEINKFKTLHQHLERLRTIKNNVIDTDQVVKEASSRIDVLLNEFVEALHQAKICPTCGQETHGVCTDQVETIIN